MTYYVASTFRLGVRRKAKDGEPAGKVIMFATENNHDTMRGARMALAKWRASFPQSYEYETVVVQCQVHVIEVFP